MLAILDSTLPSCDMLIVEANRDHPVRADYLIFTFIEQELLEMILVIGLSKS